MSDCYFEEEYDEEGNPIDPCESEYQGYNGDGMDVDMNCLDWLISRDCCYSFMNPNVVDEWCSFMCSVRGPCHMMNEERRMTLNCPRCNAPVFVKLDKSEWKDPRYPIYECQSCSYNEERFK